MTDLENLMEAAERGDVAEVKATLDRHTGLVNERDQSGATALHYAAFNGHRAVVQELVGRGADINAKDSRFDATPAGWAIEYLREMGGFLGIELDDFAHAIQQGDAEWAARFLRRFPALRNASDSQGVPFKRLAEHAGNPDIVRLFS